MRFFFSFALRPGINLIYKLLRIQSESWNIHLLRLLIIMCILFAILPTSLFSLKPAYGMETPTPVLKTSWSWNPNGDPFQVYPVAGCSYEPIQESFSSLLMQRDQVWIGTFVDVQPTSAQLYVEHVVRGDLRQAGVTVQLQWSIENIGCVHSFVKGTRWLYGGPLLQDPTVEIPANASVVTLISGDLRDQSPCTHNAECRIVPYACNRIVATHVRNDLIMRQKTQSMFGQTALLDCPVESPTAPKWPICEPTSHTCSILSVR